MSEFAARRSPWRWPLTFVATLLLLGVLLHEFGGPGLASAVHHARPAWVLAAFLIACSSVLLGTVRWRLVLAAMGCPIGFGRALQVVLATWPLAVVTPSRANELLRAVAVRDVVPLARGTGSVLVEKALDLCVLLVLAALGAAVRGLWLWSTVIATLLAGEAIAIAVIAARRGWLVRLPFLRAPGTVEGLFGAFDVLRRSPGRLATICAVSISIRVATVGIIHSLLLAVGAGVRFFDTLTLWPAATLVGVAPLTLGGMGTRDATFIYLLEARGLPADPSWLLAATMGYSAVAVWSFALIGLPFMIHEAVSARRGAGDR